MHAYSVSRIGRAMLGIVMALLTVTSATGPAAGASVIRSHGSVGTWKIVDTRMIPGARCRYEGAAGSYFLQRLRVRRPVMYGSGPALRSVGYRMLLQRRTAAGWKTTQRSTLISGNASRSAPVTLPGSAVRRDPAKSPNRGRYRAVLRLLWWNRAAQVKGVVLVGIGHYQRSYGSDGALCRGQVPIPH